MPQGAFLGHRGLRNDGGLAQLARAPALQAGGQRFESVILHRRFPYGVPDTTCWGPRRNRKVVVGKAKARVAFMSLSDIRCDALPHAFFDVLNELEVMIAIVQLN